MAMSSNIEWTDATFNPWIGCTRVSPGCINCYAEAANNRHKWAEAWGPKGDRYRTSPTSWRNPHRLNVRAAKDGHRRRVFCASLADVFDDHPSIQQAWRDDLWTLIAETPHLDWQLLTKRPENLRRFLPDDLDNIWLGISAEDQERLDARLPYLMAAPAAVRFVSAEPLIGPIRLGQWARPIDWLICGGESGPGARPMACEWAYALRDECADTGTAFFMKQLGGTRKPLPPIPQALDIREFPDLHQSRRERPSAEEASCPVIYLPRP